MQRTCLKIHENGWSVGVRIEENIQLVARRRHVGTKVYACGGLRDFCTRHVYIRFAFLLHTKLFIFQVRVYIQNISNSLLFYPVYTTIPPSPLVNYSIPPRRSHFSPLTLLCQKYIHTPLQLLKHNNKNICLLHHYKHHQQSRNTSIHSFTKSYERCNRE